MSAPITGQVSLSGTAQVLSGPLPQVTAFSIRAPTSNAHPAFIGAAGVTSATGYQLDPGGRYDYERSNRNGLPAYQLTISDFYTVGTGGDLITWLASP